MAVLKYTEDNWEEFREGVFRKIVYLEDIMTVMIEFRNGRFQLTKDASHLDVINSEHTNSGTMLHVSIAPAETTICSVMLKAGLIYVAMAAIPILLFVLMMLAAHRK